MWQRTSVFSSAQGNEILQETILKEIPVQWSLIHAFSLFTGLLERPEDFARTLYVARMTDWKDDSKMALGQV